MQGIEEWNVLTLANCARVADSISALLCALLCLCTFSPVRYHLHPVSSPSWNGTSLPPPCYWCSSALPSQWLWNKTREFFLEFSSSTLKLSHSNMKSLFSSLLYLLTQPSLLVSLYIVQKELVSQVNSTEVESTTICTALSSRPVFLFTYKLSFISHPIPSHLPTTENFLGMNLHNVSLHKWEWVACQVLPCISNV